jgi:copper chaperone
MERITLTAPDISCDHCINAIRKAVTSLPGVQMLEGNPDTKLITLEFDPGQTELEEIEDTMQDEGYPVSARS